MPLLTPEQAATELGISIQHLMELVSEGMIPYVDVGARVRPVMRFEPSDLERFRIDRTRVLGKVEHPEPAEIPEPPCFTVMDIPPDLSRGSYVYFLQCGHQVKIGRARSIKNRLRALQSGSPEKINLIHYIRGAGKQERDLHAKFADLRVHLEWFKLEGPVLDFLRGGPEPLSSRNRGVQ